MQGAFETRRIAYTFIVYLIRGLRKMAARTTQSVSKLVVILRMADREEAIMGLIYERTDRMVKIEHIDVVGVRSKRAV